MSEFEFLVNINNQTEKNFKQVCDDFIIYMLIENDADGIIYSKLRELLPVCYDDVFTKNHFQKWLYDALEPYLANGRNYIDGEERNVEGKCIKDWCSVSFEQIFTNSIELMEIQQTLKTHIEIEFDEVDISKLISPTGLLEYYMKIHMRDIIYNDCRDYNGIVSYHNHIVNLMESIVIPK